MTKLNTNSQYFKTKMKAYCGGLAFMALMCATSAAQAMEDDDRIKPGYYKIRNHEFDSGLLTSSGLISGSGYKTQALKGEYAEDHYAPNAMYGKYGVWKVSLAEEGNKNGPYIIENCGLNVGILSDTSEWSHNGYLAQVLENRGASLYNSNKDKYNPIGTLRNNISWDISSSKVSDEKGYYIIRNLNFRASKNSEVEQGLDVQEGTLASGASLSKKFIQVLSKRSSSYFCSPFKKDKYLKNGESRNRILWKFEAVGTDDLITLGIIKK